MREIDGFLIDAVGSETEDIGGKTCATDESELSMVHEGSDSSVRIEQGNIMIDFIWVCIAPEIIYKLSLIARSMPGMVHG